MVKGITLHVIAQATNADLYFTPSPPSLSMADQLLNSVDLSQSPEFISSSVSYSASSPFKPEWFLGPLPIALCSISLLSSCHPTAISSPLSKTDVIVSVTCSKILISLATE